MDEQARLTDLIPRPLWAHALVFAAGLTILFALELLYSWMPTLGQYTHADGRVAAFDLDGEGSLAVWFSSTTLLLAAAVAVIVYTVRRHRRDDYQGHYRVWLWAAMCWTLMSLDETASLHEGFKEMMCLVTGPGGRIGDGSIWWVVPYFFLLGAVGTRLLIDMRECWLSSAALVGVAVCYALAVVAQLGWILPDAGAREVMLEEGAEMLGNLLLLAAMGLHARYVIMDASGLVRHKRRPTAEPEDSRPDTPLCRPILAAAQEEEERQPEPAEPTEDETEQLDHQVTVHPPHGVPRPTAAKRTRRRKRREPVFVAVDEEDEEETVQPTEPARPAATTPIPSVQRKLTKAEKKALRRRLKKMARDRQKQG